LLLRFFVHGVCATLRAVFLHLKTILDDLLVLFRSVVECVALRTLEFDEVVLRHRMGIRIQN